MSWIFQNWQLKLLALVLSLGLFAAVAFQQNPIISRPIQNVPVQYPNPPSDIEVIGAPVKQTVTVGGLAAVVNTVGATNVEVKADLSKVRPGYRVLTATIRVLTPGVTPEADHVNFAVTVEKKVTKAVKVEARVAPGPGWQVTKSTVTVTNATGLPSDSVDITAPESFFDGLTAFVTLGPVSASTTVPGLPIQLEKAGKPVQLPNNAIPAPTADATIASLSVEALRPKQTIKVPLLETPTGTLAAGFRITAVAIDPLFIDISGSADDLTSITGITLTAIPVDGLAATFTRSVRVTTLPANVTSSVVSVSVTVTITKNPAVQPSPTPTP
jgi:YbbR domain-containing protein